MSKCPVCGNPGTHGCMGAPATPQVGLPIADEISAMFNLPPYPTPTRGAEQVAEDAAYKLHKAGLLYGGDIDRQKDNAAKIIQSAIDEAVGNLKERLEGVQFENMGDLSPMNAAYVAKAIMLGTFDAANVPKEEK